MQEVANAHRHQLRPAKGTEEADKQQGSITIAG
jgi:hypothetical protein